MQTNPQDETDKAPVETKLEDTPPPPPPPPTQGAEASYFEKLLAFIPADMVAGYMAVDGVLKQALSASIPNEIYWAVTLALVCLCPLYICFRPTENSIVKCSLRFRAVTGSIAFIVWIFALGGPFAVTFTWYEPVYGSLLLIVTTLAIPVFERIASRYNF